MLGPMSDTGGYQPQFIDNRAEEVLKSTEPSDLTPDLGTDL